MKLASAHAPTSALENVYKSFIRSILEYGEVLYTISPFHNKDKHVLPLDLTLCNKMKKLESVQYKAARIITGTWKRSSTEKIYSLLGWEHLCLRRWMKQMCLFYKIVTKKTPEYLSSQVSCMISPRNPSKLLNVHPSRTERYMKSFFPSCNFSWNHILKPNDRLSSCLLSFKSKMKAYCNIATKTNNFDSLFTREIKHINQLRVGLRALNEHKFRHKFANQISPSCPTHQAARAWRPHVTHRCIPIPNAP